LSCGYFCEDLWKNEKILQRSNNYNGLNIGFLGKILQNSNKRKREETGEIKRTSCFSDR